MCKDVESFTEATGRASSFLAPTTLAPIFLPSPNTSSRTNPSTYKESSKFEVLEGKALQDELRSIAAKAFKEQPELPLPFDMAISLEAWRNENLGEEDSDNINNGRRKKARLNPRAYQNQLFERAKDRNVIAVLDTGSGKTLVSVLLLQHVLESEIARVEGKSDSSRHTAVGQDTSETAQAQQVTYIAAQTQLESSSSAAQEVAPSERSEAREIPSLQAEHVTETTSSVALQAPNATSNPVSIDKRRISLFLVNLVPLVHQQADVIGVNSSLKVGKLFGELGVDTWKKQQWDEIIRSEKFDVIVATAQIILDGMVHGFLRMADLALMCFDECHHANLMHPYSRIMSFYHSAPVCERPQIFGMTASPLKSGSDFQKAAKELEETMDAHIFSAAQETRPELEAIVNRPRELVIEFDSPPIMAESYLTALIRHRCAEFLDQGLEAILSSRIEYSNAFHGPLIADLVWRGSFTELRTKAAEKEAITRLTEPEINLLSGDWHAEKETRSTMLDATHLLNVASLCDADAAPADPGGNGRSAQEACTRRLAQCAALTRRITDIVSSVPIPNVLQVNESNTTPKIRQLIEVLRSFAVDERAAANFCGIIFVERRQTAVALTELIRRLPELSFLKPAWLVGHESSSGAGMAWQQQTELLAAFKRRDDKLNLLVATNVLEEGLDVQICNAVIRFDLFVHHINFVQSRGRARHKNSRFIMLAQRGDARDRETILRVATSDESMRKWLDSLPENRLAEMRSVSPEGRRMGEASGRLISGGTEEEYGVWLDVPETGARLRPVDSVPLICFYVSSIRTDQYCVQAPDFVTECLGQPGEERFRTTLKLPANSRLRVVVGPLCAKKKTARRMAAFEACRQLYTMGILDNRLVPIRPPPITKELPCERTAEGELIATRSRQLTKSADTAEELQGSPVVDAEHSSPAGELKAFATVLLTPTQVEGQVYRNLLLVTSKPLPSIPSFEMLFHTGPKSVQEILASKPLSLSDSQVKHARAYTLRFLSWMTRKVWRADTLPYLVLPMAIGASEEAIASMTVDWTEIARGGDGALTVCKLSEMDILDLDDPFGGLKDRVVAELSDINYTGLYEVTGLHHNLDSALVHVHWATEDDPDPTQPVVSVAKIGRVENFLSISAKRHGKQRRNEVQYLYTDLIYVHALSASAMRSGIVFPSFLERIDQVLLTRQANRDLFNNNVNEEKLMVALAAPAAGQPIDYQTLEFLGDTFLKLIATCLVFSKTATHNEGELSLARRELVSNAVLFQHAVRFKIWRFIRAHHFSNKSWHPANLEHIPVARTRIVLGPKALARLEAKALAAAAASAEAIVAGEAEGLTTGQATVEPAASDASLPAAHAVTATKESAEPVMIAEKPVTAETAVELRKLERTQTFSEKCLADVIESCIGAALEGGGVNQGLYVAQRLGVLPDPIWSMKDFANLLAAQVAARAEAGQWSKRVDIGALRKLEEYLDYTFKSPHYALEAVTHPSLLASELPSYERMELLGDSVLDFYVVQHLRKNYPQLDAAGLTILKSNIVSNKALGALSESLGLHKFLRHAEAALTLSLNKFSAEVKAFRVAEQKKPATERRQYWWTLTPPKAMADVCESLLGAVFVDSGFNLDAGQKFFDRLYLPFIEAYCRPETIVVHSTSSLLSLIQRQGCRNWKLELEQIEVSHGVDERTAIHDYDESRRSPGTRCRLTFHDKVLAERSAVGRQAAQLETCKVAMAELEKDGFRMLETLCNCRAQVAAELAARQEQKAKRRALEAAHAKSQLLASAAARAAAEAKAEAYKEESTGKESEETTDEQNDVIDQSTNKNDKIIDEDTEMKE